ncbi:MAG TPA: hypothetical protein VGM88_10715 [Kofleriaceae bacterium]|jgi:muconolactone delta-isomerase
MSIAIERAAVELAWRQWTALGVSGVAPPPVQAIDLEALIALTPSLALSDPRLVDEARDWCIAIGPSFVSIARLRQLRRLMPASPSASADLPALLIEHRRSTKRSGKSRTPRLAQPALLQLRSRYTFGVGVRADLLARLAMLDSMSAWRVTELQPTGYTKRATSAVLDELAQVGILRKLALRAHVVYQLDNNAALRALLAPLPPRMPPWAERFAVVAQLLHAWRRYGERATYVVELAKTLASLSRFALATGPAPAARGLKIEHVDAWALAFLADDAGL